MEKDKRGIEEDRNGIEKKNDKRGIEKDWNGIGKKKRLERDRKV